MAKLLRQIELRGADLREDLERFIVDRLNIETTGIQVSDEKRSVYQQKLMEAQACIVIDLVAALLHGVELLKLVTFCYDYNFQLVIRGDFKIIGPYLVSLLMKKNDLPEETAKTTVEILFPGGYFIRNLNSK